MDNFNFTERDYIPPLIGIVNFNFGATPTNMCYVLKGSSNNFNSIWVFGNRMYVGSIDALTVINLSDDSIYDWYSETRVGRAGEALQSDDIVDINVI